MDILAIKANIIDMMRRNGADNNCRTLINVFTEMGSDKLQIPKVFESSVKPFGNWAGGPLHTIQFSIGYPAVGPHFNLDKDFILLPVRRGGVNYDLFIPYRLIWLIENEGIPGASFNFGMAPMAFKEEDVREFEKARIKPDLKLAVVADKDLPEKMPADSAVPELVIDRDSMDKRIDVDAFLDKARSDAQKADRGERIGEDPKRPKPTLTIVK